MSSKSSGTYVIDENYNVIAVNQTILDLYPSLKVGKKCYQCLMNRNEPCPPCPVANHVQGPQTYMDPIRRLYETVDAVEINLPDGQLGHALVISTVGESETIAAKLPRTREELEKLLDQEYFDTLTDGSTRKGFIRETERIFSRRNKTDYAMILFDIRNFKAINETFGTEGGDQVLRFVYQFLAHSWLKPAVSARIESDWFLFLVPKSCLKEEQLSFLLNLDWVKDSRVVHLHLRCGIYYVEENAASVSTMVDWTIIAKQSAGPGEYNTYAVFTPDMREKYVDRAEILSGFANSLVNKEFQVYYQPIIEASTGKLCAAEALVRWNHPRRGFILPGRFIPALESSGFITQLDQYVLQHVYSFQEYLRAKKQPMVPVSVNLSRQDFYNNAFMNDLFTMAEDSTLPADSISYEVTETSVAVLGENCSYLLNQIRQIGARILLDDFGSGYSSLSMIGNYSFDTVKIDKSFIDQIETKPSIRAVIESTITMCHNLGLTTVAEGVESISQLNYLKEHGCDFIQGYYYSKPLSEQHFLEYLSAAEIAETHTLRSFDQNDPGRMDMKNLMDLVDHSGMFIQVCHPEDYSMVYANQMTLEISGHPDLPYKGARCYQYMLGFNAPCGHCPMKQMGSENEKEIEVDDGAHVFSLKARYTTWNGRKVFMEYGRDITDTKKAQHRYADQIRGILECIPEGQGVFHVDLTEDRWLSSGGNAQNARNMQNMSDVNTLIHQIASFVPDEEGQKRFFDTFSREAQLRAKAEHRHQILLETESYYDDRSIRWSRITAHLIENPETGHTESIIYGVDISKEKAHIEEIERERQKENLEKDQLRQRIDETMELYQQADRDRRYDYLTGLGSRLDLHDFLKKAEEQERSPVTAVVMLDLDNFKLVNDTFGHDAGDRCLKILGEKLTDFGLQHNITFYRFGGEEIVGLFRSSEENVSKTVSSLLELIRTQEIILSDGQEISVTASAGYTSIPGDYHDMITNADHAMYEAKKHGKNQSACLDRAES